MGTFGISIQQHKGVKGLAVVKVKGRRRQQDYLQPTMTKMELALSTFANNLASALHDERDSQGFGEIRRDVQDAGELSGSFRKQIEEKTGKPVVSPRNMAIEKDGGLWGQIDDSDSI